MPDHVEVWKDVRLFDRYQVSSLGQVRSTKRGVPKILRQRPAKGGYRTVGLYIGRKQIHCYVHRLVCESFHGPAPEPGMHAAHDDGKPDNNRASNLAWKTPTENLADKVRHGTHGAGVKHGCHRIDDDIVRQIFERRADGQNLKAIALEVGLHFSHVADIIARNTWSHVDLPTELIERAQSFDGRRKRAA